VDIRGIEGLGRERRRWAEGGKGGAGPREGKEALGRGRERRRWAEGGKGGA
jgi:hypothetical protein